MMLFLLTMTIILGYLSLEFIKRQPKRIACRSQPSLKIRRSLKP